MAASGTDKQVKNVEAKKLPKTDGTGRRGSVIFLLGAGASDKALDSLENVLKHTVMVLRADGLYSAVPVNLENWKAIFRQPWISA